MSATVVLCGDAAISRSAAGDDVIVVDGLCRRPSRIHSVVDSPSRLVLGVCEGDYSLGNVQAEVRKLGVDPLGVELFDLGSASNDAERVNIELNARVARAEAFAGSSPANAKISFPKRMSRRDLLRGPQHQYQAAPSIDSDLCTSGSGCRACAEVCPRGALSIESRQVFHDRAVCEPCGLCVTACPTGATVNPAVTPAQVEAEIFALLDQPADSAEPRGIVFACERGTAFVPSEGWFVVAVPCTAMATPAWLLAPLLMGAGAVASLPCSDNDCALGHDARTIAAVDFCRDYLKSIGESAERISTETTFTPPEPLPRFDLGDAFGPLGAIEAMLALAARNHTGLDLVVPHRGSPTGVISIDTGTCTACTMCAQACPTDALISDEFDDPITIAFDAAKCTACSQCLRVCPEISNGAITLNKAVDLAALSLGQITLLEVESVKCVSCGGPIAPAPMMAHIASMLGPEQDSVKAMITSKCIDCRGLTR